MTQTSQMGNSSTSMNTAIKVLGFENGYFKHQSTISNLKMTGGMGGASDAAKKAMEKPTIIYFDKQYRTKFDTKSKDGMSQMMSGMNNSLNGVTFPAKPVKIGETWTNVIDMGKMMSAASKDQPAAAGLKSNGKMNMTYKLLKVTPAGILIGMNLSGTVNMDMGGAKGAGGAQGMKMNMTMKGSGTFTVEKGTGIPINSDVKMSMQMGGMGQAFTMNQTIATKRI